MKINGKQTVKLKSGVMKFKNHFKQLAAPFKIYVDFECHVKRVRGRDRKDNTSYTGKYKKTLPWRVWLLPKSDKKQIDKNLVMSAEDEQRFQSSSKYWICDKLFDAGDNKVRDHCHVTGRVRASDHWSCNINLKLSKKVPVIFHNWKGFGSHLIMQGICKFDVKVNFIPNRLGKKRLLQLIKTYAIYEL